LAKRYECIIITEYLMQTKHQAWSVFFQFRTSLCHEDEKDLVGGD